LQVDNIKKIYRVQSSIYDIIFKKFFYPRQKHVIETMVIEPNQTILDVGIGTGMALPLYPKHSKVVGIDLSIHMLEEALKKKKKEGIDHVELIEMDAEELAFADNSFDHVIATFVVSVVPDPVKLIREMKRVCKKDGSIILVNHFKSPNPVIGGIEKMINPLCTRLGWRTDVVLEHLIEDADLKVVNKYKMEKIDLWNIVIAENSD